jgi:uncharacterized protein (DUF1778 family)
MRLPPADVELIDRAARQLGRARTEFVRDAAVQAAERTLLDASPVRMTGPGFSEFAKAIAGPGRAVKELVAILRRAAPWE